MDEIEYTIVPPERYQDVIQHLRQSFFVDEPLNKSLSLCQPGESREESGQHCFHVLQQGMSAMATLKATQEVVGAALLGCPAWDKKITSCKDKILERILSFLKEQEDQADYGMVLKDSEIADFKIISVDSRLRGKGIANKLYRQAEDTARQRNFKIIRTDATSFFSQLVFEKHGWRTIRQIKYSEYPTAENPTFKVCPPHEYAKVMAKYLDF